MHVFSEFNFSAVSRFVTFKSSSKILPRIHEFMLSMTALLRTELPKMWLTCCICGPEQPFAAGNGSRDLLFKVFSMLAIFLPKKLFLSNLLTLVFYNNFKY